MSQHDFNIANQTFPSFRADLNNALVAAATMSAGASAPTTPYAYQLWFDTTTGTWKVRNSGNTAWVSTITTDLTTGNLDVTGTVTADGLTVDGTSRFNDYIHFGGSISTPSTAAAIYRPADNQLAFSTANSEAMRIDASGNVGISAIPETTYVQKTTLRLSTTASLIAGTSYYPYPYYIANNLNYDASDNLKYIASSGGALLSVNAHTGGSFSFYTAATGTAGATASLTERLKITTDGNVTIGTSGTSQYRLKVVDPVNRGESNAQFSIAGAGYNAFHFLDGQAYYISQNSNTRSLRVYSGTSGGVALAAGGTSWGTFSDERLKTDIEPIENGVDKLANLRCVSYRLTAAQTDDDGNPTQKKLGLIAQDLEGVIDEIIDRSKLNDEEETEYLSVRYTEVIPVLVKAIQEQQATITSLEARITALEAS